MALAIPVLNLLAQLPIKDRQCFLLLTTYQWQLQSGADVKALSALMEPTIKDCLSQLPFTDERSQQPVQPVQRKKKSRPRAACDKAVRPKDEEEEDELAEVFGEWGGRVSQELDSDVLDNPPNMEGSDLSSVQDDINE